MIIKFLFNTVKILVIWLIIGITAAVAYKHIKPYYQKAIPVLKRGISEIEPTVNNFNKKINLNKISKTAIDTINELSDKISADPKPIAVQKSRKKVAVLSPEITNATRKDELIDRQLSLLNELMK